LSAAVKANAGDIPNSTTGAPGDGGLALSISNLQSSSLAGLGGNTFGDFYNNLISGLGQTTATVQANQNTQNSIVNQVQNQQQSISGVSLDEELSNMTKLQESYGAAAKVLTICDQVTENLINLIQ